MNAENCIFMYSKTPQSADFGTEQNCTADCEIRRLRVLLWVVNGAEWCITQCYPQRAGSTDSCINMRL